MLSNIPDFSRSPNILPKISKFNRGRLRVALEFAVQNIWSARRRMLLAVLGVGIGFGAIDSMLIIGSSVEARIQSSLDSLGGDILTVSLSKASEELSELAMRGVAGRGRVRGPSIEKDASMQASDLTTVASLVEQMLPVNSTAWISQISNCTPAPDELTTANYQLYESSLQTAALLSIQLSMGRRLNPGDFDQPTVIFGDSAMQELRRQQPNAGIGTVVTVCGRRLTIVGIAKPHAGNDLVQALRINDAVLLATKSPEISKNDLQASNQQQSMLIRLQKNVPSQAFGQQLTERVQKLLPGYNVQVSGAWESIKQRQEQAGIYARFLAILGSVSLLVGALGIANMMLVTVAERKAEIGLRLAIGAKPQDIVAQFLIESVLICSIGSTLGMVIGFIVAKIALNVGGFDVILSGIVILKASALAVACGIVAGAYPAHQASRVDPISSLQGES